MKKAFTLAEVLVTLGIIGIVAALTLPALIQKNQDKELISRTRKIYSDINNAVLRAQSDFGVVGDNSFLFNPNNTSEQSAENFLKYFNGAKLCKSKSDKGCEQYFYEIKFSSPNASGSDGTFVADTSNHPRLVLNNGAVVTVYQYNNPDCYAVTTSIKRDEYYQPILDKDGNTIKSQWTNRRCAFLRMDVNGPKNPNQFGHDAFELIVEKGRVSTNGWSFTGQQSLTNIISGKDELIYTNYVKGGKVKL